MDVLETHAVRGEVVGNAGFLHKAFHRIDKPIQGGLPVTTAGAAESKSKFLVVGRCSGPVELQGGRQEKSVILRGVTIRMGGAAYLAHYPMSGADCKRDAVRNTLTLAHDLGRAVRLARSGQDDPIEAIA